MSTRGGSKNDLKTVIHHQAETINQLTANVCQYQDYIARGIYHSSCRLSQAIPYHWNDIPENAKREWRQRADEAVLSFVTQLKQDPAKSR